MRYFSSRPFVVGLLLVAGAVAVMPLFVTELTEQTCSTLSPANPSWDCSQLMAIDFRIPVVIAASGLALMLVTVVRMNRLGGRD
jgi:hypothetical protein